MLRSGADDAVRVLVGVASEQLGATADGSASGDLDAIAAVIAQAKGYTTTARLIRLENELVAAQAAVIEAVDKLAALHG